MKRIRYLTLLVLLVGSISSWGQDFDPTNPAEPGLPPSQLTLVVSPSDAGYVSGGGRYIEGASVPLRAYCYTGFSFDRWTDADGNTVSTSAYFSYTKGARKETLTANYKFNPTAPDEPQDPALILYYQLTLKCEEGGSVSGGGRYLEGSAVNLRAYTNTGFDFDGWYDIDGNRVSTSSNYSYTMPGKKTTLTARFNFNPSNPGEPSEPILKYSVMATATDGGNVNFSQKRELTGTKVTLQASPNTGYVFDGWYLEGELYTKSTNFVYTIGEANVSFEARFRFDPSNPSEPSAPTIKNNAFYLMNKVTKPGGTVVFPVYLISQEDLKDLSFQLTFPKSMKPDLTSIALAEQAVGYDIDYDIREETDETISYMFSLLHGTVPEGDIPLLGFTVNVPQSTETGKGYQVIINQVSIVDGSDNNKTAATRNGRISVYKLGDTNGDNVVNSADVLNIVSVGLQKSTDVFIGEVSDINEDGEFTSADVLGIVGIALEEE